MFASKDEIIKKVDEIICDEIDNEIVFVVASKGLGKIKLLNEICDFKSSRKDIIIANGNRIRGSASTLTRCFIDGICSYIEMHDAETCINELMEYLPNAPQKNRIFESGKINITRLSALLSTLSPGQLKDIFVQLAESTPLVLVASSIFLNAVDVEYLESLYFDNWGAKVTFVIALRPTSDCVKTLRAIAKNNENRIWVFPLLPKVVKDAYSISPKSIASIYVDNIGISDDRNFTEALLSNDVYFDTYNLINELLSNDIQLTNLFFLANQEIRVCDSKYLKDIVKKIYGDNSNKGKYDEKFVLPHNGKLLWIDALSYFLIIYDGGISKAIVETQKFFFDIMNNINHFDFGQPERKSLVCLLNEISIQKPNELASGFSNYFSSFAYLCKTISVKKRKQNIKKISPELISTLLERLVLDFTDACTDTLSQIYDNTQLCFVLDIGLDTIIHYFSLSTTTTVSFSSYKKIQNFIIKCVQEAKKWNDETLSIKIATLERLLKEKQFLITNEDYDKEVDTDSYSESAICINVQRALLNLANNSRSSILQENDLNDLLRDLLGMVYKNIKDQTRRGRSESGKSAGNLDILICNDVSTAVALIEPLRLYSFNKEYLSTHINKTLLNYNPDGCKTCITIIYSSVEKFEELWTKVFSYLLVYNFQLPSEGAPVDIDTRVTELRHAKVNLMRSGQTIAFHLYAINLYQQPLQ